MYRATSRWSLLQYGKVPRRRHWLATSWASLRVREIVGWSAFHNFAGPDAAWTGTLSMALPWIIGGACIGLTGATKVGNAELQKKDPTPKVVADSQSLVNWSGTHTVDIDRYYQPETMEELKVIVKSAHEKGTKLRPVGSALSPNGLAFQSEGMLNLALMDEVISVDNEKMQVTVQAGARVSQVVEALRPHGLTLMNYASITEQQIGGLIQVGAHGTGSNIPPLDEAVVALKLVTPAVGEIALSLDDDDPSLFKLARTSLGLLGIVAEVTLQCIPAHRLEEKTFVVSREEVRQHHRKWLSENKHLRYMWIPYANCVVVVACNPVSSETQARLNASERDNYAESARLHAARSLLISHPKCSLSKREVNTLSFTSLRDELLALDPLNAAWVKQVNIAEAEYWKKSGGIRVDWSDRILQFDCGGQQWVSEIAFPVPETIQDLVDVTYVEDVIDIIESKSIPAPCPIEQRWSAASTSPLSPVSEKPDRDLAPFYSWVGIIMYLPDASADDEDASMTRARITEAFKEYKRLCEINLWQNIRAVEHWAKVEYPSTAEEAALLHSRLADKYPLEAFNAIRSLFDPKGVLGNELTKTIFEGGAIVKGSFIGSSPAETHEK